MIKTFLTTLVILCLAGCATPSARGDLSVSDLLALQRNVEADLQPRVLPNGKEYCAEEAKTREQMDRCTGWLEDGFFLQNQDKARGRSTLDKGIRRLVLVRNPCGWFRKMFDRKNCVVE